MDAKVKALREVVTCMDRHCAAEIRIVAQKADELQKRVNPINGKIAALEARHAGGHIANAVYTRQMHALLSSLYAIIDAFQTAPAAAGRNACTSRMCQSQLVRQFATLKQRHTGAVTGKNLADLALKELRLFR